jgi:uncharacterized membrane protein YfbV (UPF0208 family)
MIEATILAASILAIVRVIKQTNRINEAYLPVVAILVGVTLNLLGNGFTFEVAFQGMLIALTAMGVYDVAKQPVTELYEGMKK